MRVPRYVDAVLRVLAEHGNTQQVREELQRIMQGSTTSGNGVDRVMAVVAPIVAARDAAAEQLERYDGQAWEDLQADLAAARQQLDQVRAMCAQELRKVRRYVGEGADLARAVEKVLDAPARPAGHDETGQ
jgi:hypothetical protein